MLVEGCFTEERTMSRLMTIVQGWLMLNVALAALLVYQYSPHLRHQLFRWTIGGLTPPRQRRLAHALLNAARRRR
jgi:hypothetical protein